MSSTMLFQQKQAGASASRDPSFSEAFESESTLKTPRFPGSTPVPAWMSPPEPVKDALAQTRHDSDLFDASLRAVNHFKRRDNSMPSLKMVEFSVELPDAHNVQLAADFTDWEEGPIDMMLFEGGYWSTTVPLPPGIYAYRFLVDGEWYDDPRVVRRDPQSTGPAKSYVQVK